MRTWREVFRFGDEDVSFAEVHDRYRQLMMSYTDIDLEMIRELNTALDAARDELGTRRIKR